MSTRYDFSNVTVTLDGNPIKGVREVSYRSEHAAEPPGKFVPISIGYVTGMSTRDQRAQEEFELAPPIEQRHRFCSACGLCIACYPEDCDSAPAGDHDVERPA